METARFLNFQVYKDSKLFYAEAIQASGPFLHSHRELADQLRRASLSVSLNIAEGSAKYSDKEFHRYLEIAIGSIHESLACLDIALSQKLIKKSQFDTFYDEATSIAKQLGGLEKHIRGR